jgi:heme-degrading monooxygenase HmoA
MFAVFVDFKLKPGEEPELKKTYLETFRPAISRQEGFRGVELLKPDTGEDPWRLSIAFENPALQKKWVALDLHQQVWGQMEGHFTDYTVHTYNSL